MEQWKQDYVDQAGPGRITFCEDGAGRLRFGRVELWLDWRHEAPTDRVNFSFHGLAEGAQTFGRGWAKLEGNQLWGYLAFHLSIETGFKAGKCG